MSSKTMIISPDKLDWWVKLHSRAEKKRSLMYQQLVCTNPTCKYFQKVSFSGHEASLSCQGCGEITYSLQDTDALEGDTTKPVGKVVFHFRWCFDTHRCLENVSLQVESFSPHTHCVYVRYEPGKHYADRRAMTQLLSSAAYHKLEDPDLSQGPVKNIIHTLDLSDDIESFKQSLVQLEKSWTAHPLCSAAEKITSPE